MCGRMGHLKDADGGGVEVEPAEGDAAAVVGVVHHHRGRRPVAPGGGGRATALAYGGGGVAHNIQVWSSLQTES